MAKSILSSPKIAKFAGAPYSSGTKVGNLLFTAGMVSLDEKGEIVGRGDIRAQTRQALENMKAVLEAGGGKMTDVAKTTVYITDVANYAGMNEVYKTFFPTDPPARAMAKVELLNKDLLVEIEAFAVLG